MSKSNQSHPKQRHPEKVQKFLTDDSTIRASVVIATNIVEEMRKSLGTYPLATVALGRSLIGSILMSSHLKQGHTVGVYFRGSGPLGTLFAESDYEGSCRAYTANPKCDLPLVNGQLDIRSAVGHGLLEVVRGTPHQKQAQSGTVIIQTGEIGDDIAYYLHQSYQISSVVALGVEIDSYGVVVAAGGVIVELMPGARDEQVVQLEQRVKAAGSISKMISQGATHRELADVFLKDFNLIELEHNYEVKYECRCSLDRVKRSLLLLGYEEIDDMIAQNKSTDVTCEFCGKLYSVSLEELQKLREKSYKSSLN